MSAWRPSVSGRTQRRGPRGGGLGEPGPQGHGETASSRGCGPRVHPPSPVVVGQRAHASPAVPPPRAEALRTQGRGVGPSHRRCAPPPPQVASALVTRRGEARLPVLEHDAVGGLRRQRVRPLLEQPCRRGVGGHLGLPHPARGLCPHHHHRAEAQGYRAPPADGTRHTCRRLLTPNSPPALRCPPAHGPASPGARQIWAPRAWGHPQAQRAAALVGTPRWAPRGRLPGHAMEERGRISRHGRSSRTSLPPPAQPAPVPGPTAPWRGVAADQRAAPGDPPGAPHPGQTRGLGGPPWGQRARSRHGHLLAQPTLVCGKRRWPRPPAPPIPQALGQPQRPRRPAWAEVTSQGEAIRQRHACPLSGVVGALS